MRTDEKTRDRSKPTRLRASEKRRAIFTFVRSEPELSYLKDPERGLVHLPYLQAYWFAEGKGMRLPSIREYLMELRSNPTRTFHSCGESLHTDVFGSRMGGWMREICVSSGKDGCLPKDSDITDPETGWMFPARSIPDEAKGRRGVELLVDPAGFEHDETRTVIVPETIEIMEFDDGWPDGLKEPAGTGFSHEEILQRMHHILRKDDSWPYRMNDEGVVVRPLQSRPGVRPGGKKRFFPANPDIPLQVSGVAESILVEIVESPRDIVTLSSHIPLSAFRAIAEGTDLAEARESIDAFAGYWFLVSVDSIDQLRHALSKLALRLQASGWSLGKGESIELPVT